MTCSRRNRSASAWGSSRVLMIGTAAGGGRRHPLPDVLGPLRQAEHRATRRLQHLAGAGEDLAAHEERDEDLGVVGEVVAAARQVVLVAPVGIARRVGVVLEQVDDAPDALLAQARLGAGDEMVEDPLPRLVVGHEVGDRVALGRGVLGVAADVEIEPGAVLEEHVRRPSPADDTPEQVPGHLVGRQAALAAQRTGDAVLVLEPEDPPVHVTHGSAGCAWRRPPPGRSGRRSVPFAGGDAADGPPDDGRVDVRGTRGHGPPRGRGHPHPVARRRRGALSLARAGRGARRGGPGRRGPRAHARRPGRGALRRRGGRRGLEPTSADRRPSSRPGTEAHSERSGPAVASGASVPDPPRPATPAEPRARGCLRPPLRSSASSSWPSRRKARRPLPRASTATSRSSGSRVRSGPASAATVARRAASRAQPSW